MPHLGTGRARATSLLLSTTATIAAAIASIAIAGCSPEITCTSEVTDGSGTHRATATGRKPSAEIEREAVRAACGKLCAAKGSAADDACTSRCSVDAAARKIGARTTCTGGEGP